MNTTWQQEKNVLDQKITMRNITTGLLCVAIIACVLCAFGGALIGMAFL